MKAGKRWSLGIFRDSKALFPVVILVPPVSFRNQEWTKNSPRLYHLITSAQGGVRKDSIALLDQVQVLDVNRVHGFVGQLDREILEPMIRVKSRTLKVFVPGWARLL